MAILGAAPALVQAEEVLMISGKVEQMLSGDEFVLTHPDHGSINIHLLGVDAPELASNGCKAQPWADQAKRYLTQTLHQQSVSALCLRQLDEKGFAQCRIKRGNQVDVNRALLAQGYAWFDKHLGNDLSLAQAEQQAREEKVGIWSDRLLITAPWKYREDCAAKR